MVSLAYFMINVSVKLRFYILVVFFFFVERFSFYIHFISIKRNSRNTLNKIMFGELTQNTATLFFPLRIYGQMRLWSEIKDLIFILAFPLVEYANWEHNFASIFISYFKLNAFLFLFWIFLVLRIFVAFGFAF